jgi:ribosomal protein S27E
MTISPSQARQKPMSFSTVIARCSGCGPREPHQCVYSLANVQHLRCKRCGSVRAFCTGSTPSLLDHSDLTCPPSATDASAYRTEDTFAAGQLLVHAKFGLGYVLAVLMPPTRMDVLFADRQRTLVCGPDSWPTGAAPAKAEAAPAEPKPARPRRKPSREAKTSSTTERDNSPVKCPKCGATVHPFNLRHSPDDRPAGCMLCL